MYNSLLRLHFPVPKKCQNYTYRGCLNQGFVYTNCHVSAALKLFWRLEPPKKGSYRNFPFFFLFCPLTLNEILFLSPPFRRPRGTAEKKAKKEREKSLTFPQESFLKVKRPKKSSKKEEQACSSSNCTNIFSAFLLTCCEKYQDYCKMRTFEQSVTNETFLSFFI